MAPNNGSRLRRGGAIGGITALGIAAIAFTGSHEGLVLKSYQTQLGGGKVDVWTACYGSTKGIKPGQRFSKAQCDQKLLDDLIAHESGMRACLKAPDALPDPTYQALLDFTFNLGVGAFCRSPVRAEADRGNIKAACNAMSKYVYAQGQKLPGLVRRRDDDIALCLEGA